MSCAVFTFIGLYGLVRGKGNNWLISASLLAAIILFLVAAYLTWKDEHDTRLAAESRITLPKFTGSIEYVFATYSEPNDSTIVLVQLEIRSLGADSPAVGWRMSIKSESFVVEEVPFFAGWSEIRGIKNGSEVMVIKEKECLQERTASLIPRGSILAGWVPFLIKGNHQNLVNQRPAVTISFIDYIGNKYSVFTIITGPSAPKYFVGAGQPFLKDPNA